MAKLTSCRNDKLPSLVVIRIQQDSARGVADKLASTLYDHRPAIEFYFCGGVLPGTFDVDKRVCPIKIETAFKSFSGRNDISMGTPKRGCYVLCSRKFENSGVVDCRCGITGGRTTSGTGTHGVGVAFRRYRGRPCLYRTCLCGSGSSW
ncbi:MAG: hypothetical protein PHH93_11020 [Prolixibacteraceae bacterium]|nr:hypothetical protein [Prolixibacteraceae bacterium]